MLRLLISQRLILLLLKMFQVVVGHLMTSKWLDWSIIFFFFSLYLPYCCWTPGTADKQSNLILRP